MTGAAHPDLLPEPEPGPEDGPMPGEMRGEIDAMVEACSKVEVWCGPRMGWRPLGELLGGVNQRVVLVVHRGRTMAGPTFSLGPAPAGRDDASPSDASDAAKDITG